LDQYPLGPLNRIVMMGSWAYHQQTFISYVFPKFSTDFKEKEGT
jgi:hypothetical protein